MEFFSISYAIFGSVPFFSTILSFSESMAKVHVCNVIVLDNPSPFLNPFQFEITFECIEVKYLVNY
jgi:hypothetical protein